jgi:formylglycine-generating enzyme required for sulfatase activity
MQAPSSIRLIPIYFIGLSKFFQGENDMRAVVLIFLFLIGTPAFGQQPKAITNSSGMKLVLILPGTFTMGSPEEENRRKRWETQHQVSISNWYYLGRYEVTQGQYEEVMGNNPSKFKGAKNPVETVSWEDAVSFCTKLSEVPEEKAAGRVYRLPTEAEWEYACRAGSTTAFGSGDSAESLEEFAWFGENPEDKHHPVGEKKPNRWGLYDMHGNVFEWCHDLFASYPTGAATDPQGHSGGSLRTYRGGSWFGVADGCRSASRNWYEASFRSSYIGFRVALTLPPKQPESESLK